MPLVMLEYVPVLTLLKPKLSWLTWLLKTNQVQLELVVVLLQIGLTMKMLMQMAQQEPLGSLHIGRNEEHL
jgi:hypothetical protein